MVAAEEPLPDCRPDPGRLPPAVSQFCYSRLWPVLFHPEAATELQAIPVLEQTAVGHAVEKLESLGPNLGYPHSSRIRIADKLRELRPRGGRSRWRVFYTQVGDAFVVGAIGPEAKVSQRNFTRAVAAAERRIKDVEVD
ncbi:type II toxin-antitoxin system RelE/ParE family toxin [Micromonospora sp. WMMD1155]|uniref:type II toxin-antitoxin system RelE/ParE family toxin n=1 Tax=Micromonospora sp. WMMD1155 TaxID=3016094 RepID=UPI00249CC907|nr:type II toxin-antitoxin system RelE/ParE family toxin [Micromonospora sp. WMMD1155]WFE51068.1 type II toxin-antitoxin system RelE/ParE family toxin [Micromonospora sp. WMMD1155]